MLAKVAAIFDRTIDLLAFVAGFLIILMLLAVGSEVVSRYFLNRAIVGVVDVAEILIELGGNVSRLVLVDDRRALGHSLFGIEHRRKRFEVDLY